MKASRPVAVILIVMWASACIPIPIPADEVTSGYEISEEEVLFIESGVTTKQQVLERLGDPSVIWEDERVVAYNWDHVGLRVANLVAGGYTAGVVVVDVLSHIGCCLGSLSRDPPSRPKSREDSLTCCESTPEIS